MFFVFRRAIVFYTARHAQILFYHPPKFSRIAILLVVDTTPFAWLITCIANVHEFSANATELIDPMMIFVRFSTTNTVKWISIWVNLLEW